jgi:hypothetical protein
MDVSYFYSLVRIQQPRKMRQCLRCRKSFVSSSSGHRICGACRAVISSQGYLAASMPQISMEREEVS